MQRLILTLTAITFALSLDAQTLFSEDFGSGCNQGQIVTAYASPNGSWTITNTGTNQSAASTWYASAMENNTGEGNCGQTCGSNPTLHLGNVTVLGITADQGAAYYEGLDGLCGLIPCGATSKRAESPIIDCSGHENIVLDFLYLEGGNTIDNASVWYFDGTSWIQLDDPPKTFSPLCSPQGMWTTRSLNLPASANDNPNVRIGFQWINNDDADATDPSFAVDDILITGTEIVIETGTCPGDFNEDGSINAADLLLFLSDFGCTSDCTYEMIEDDMVSVADLLAFLEVFGTDCPE